jgi:hypothetical protein
VTAGLAAYLAGIPGFLLLGLFIGVRRPHDPAARIAAWLFLSTSAAFGLLNGWPPSGGRHRRSCRPCCGFRDQPFRRRSHRRLVLRDVPASAVSQTLDLVCHLDAGARDPSVAVSWFHAVIYRYGHLPPVPGWFNRAIFIRAILYAAVTLVFLTVSYRWRAMPTNGGALALMFAGHQPGRGHLCVLVFSSRNTGQSVASSA